MNYFAIGHLNAAGGVQVTASHNPAEYNGLKFSRHGARPVSGDHGIPLIEKTRSPPATCPGGGDAGRGRPRRRLREPTARTCSPSCADPAGARRLKVVVDAANGMGAVDRPILEALGRRAHPALLRARRHLPQPRGEPAQGREPARPRRRRCASTGADLGVAFDGDADRAAFVDESGEPVGSDLMTALIAGELLAREPGKAVLYDLRSSRAVREYIAREGRRAGARAGRPLLHEGDAAARRRHLRRRARRALLLPRQLLRRLRACSPWSRC